MGHILERALLHFVASVFLVLAVYFALHYWLRHNARARLWLSSEPRHILAVAALSVFAISALREPVDVAMGQSVVKAFTDFFSWFSGTAVAAWGLYRFKTQ